MRLVRTFLACLLVVLLAGCSNWMSYISPHKIDVQQGNFVTQDMVAKLKPGMTKSQVRFILGTPLLTDMFHADRWDYFYSFQKEGVVTEKRHITVFFANDQLQRVEGDVKAPAPTAENQTK